MSLTRTDHTVDYDITGDGLVSFPFSFPVRDGEDIHCYDLDATGAATEIPASRFEVIPSTDGLSGGGTVRLAAALTVGHVLRIARETPVEQHKAFTNQATIPPAQVESGLDILTMIAQEHGGRLDGVDADLDTVFAEIDALHTADADLSAALAAEAQARQQADARLQENIDAEATARQQGDAALQSAMNTERTERQQADSQLGSRIEAARSEAAALVAALQAGKADASDLAAFRASVDAKLSDLQTGLDGKMPKAPDDGTWLGSGGQWIAHSQEAGDPFIEDPFGYAVLVSRNAYIPNDVWNIGTDYLTLSDAAATGDGDSLFVVDSDGYLVLR